MPLSQLLYVSRASKLFSSTLRDLATRANEANRKRNVTGLLVYSSGNFIQLLEGREAILQLLFEKIRVDPRHEDVQQLYFAPTQERLFTEWNFGLLDLSKQTELKVEPLRQILDRAQTIPRLRDDTSALLAAFKEFRQQMVGAKMPPPAAGDVAA